MYCHACGRRLPARSAFCPSCGAAQPVAPAPPPRSTIHPALITLALVFFFPLGLILMWTSSDWDDDVKWAITGFIFPPLWTRFLWKIPWLPYAFDAFIAALLLNGVINHGLSLVAAVLILTVITLWLLVTRPSGRKSAAPDAVTALRQEVEERLDACNDLIADIEGGVALDLLPASAHARQLYARALEMRSEGARLFGRAVSMQELRRADERITTALHELRAVRDGIPDTHAR